MSAVGLAVPASSIDDHFVAALVHALADPLLQAGRGLVTRVVEDRDAEERAYRHWAEVGGIDAVALLDVHREDGRVELLRSLGFPLAGVVHSSLTVDFPAVSVDFDASLSVLRAFLATRSHDTAVYITGPDDGGIGSARSAAVETAGGDDLFHVVRVERGVDSAVSAAIAAVQAGPVTLVFDSDVHAAAALGALRERGSRIPEDVAIVSWTNSALCQSASPSITALDRRGTEIGALLGERILHAIDGADRSSARAPEPFVVVGETT
ncbi:hypothetical protein ASF48_02115 [Rathayibacter sp. Leaf299]|uniref:substrate-binding domain-containing protein n=1 Tax=unclassified Rathayibacter TaxID=2609250 RepID=UPI0006F6F6BA|nr:MULTISPECIES: substrate-binding domain-containing protein [unclassified Rathayibacter]KQQ22046.1 hypothetical protein ASF48_02115 [Rathayibacter sp. Leaf299]